MSRRTALMVVNRVSDTFRSRLPLVRVLRQRGLEVVVAGSATASTGEVLSGADLRFRELSIGTGSRIGPGTAGAVAQFRRWSRDLDPSILHVFNTRAILVTAPFLAKSLRPRSLVTLTGLGRLLDGGRLRTAAEAWLLRRALGNVREVVCQNFGDLETLRHHDVVDRDEGRVVLSSGVDPDRFGPATPGAGSGTGEPGEATIGYASGRLIEGKGLAHFFAVIRRLRRSGMGNRVVLAGRVSTGDPRSLTETEMGERCAELGVEWLGYVDDMERFYREIDVFVYPSVYGEGIPRVLIEAAMCGCACFVWDRPQLSPVVEPRFPQGVVPTGDVEELAARVRSMVDGSDGLPMLDAVGSEIANFARRRFSASRVASEYDRIYREML